MKRLVTIIAAPLLLAACAGLDSTASLVEDNNWIQLGQQDGLRGVPQRSPKEINALAAKYDASKISYNNYEEGYLAGIDRYCNPSQAYQIGLDGNQYFGVCESHVDGQRFRMEWRRGYDNYLTHGTTF